MTFECFTVCYGGNKQIILYMNPQICPHLARCLLSFPCIPLRSFHISPIPFQRLSDLDCPWTDPLNSTANKYHGADKEGGLLAFHQGTSYQTDYHQHAISHQAGGFKVIIL